MTNNKGFSEKETDFNPFNQFDKWYKDHLTKGIDIPDSASLGTVSSDGRVSVRTILLKEYDESGFVFYTNYKSRKGSQLNSNNRAALLFYWAESGRQVRIEGVVDKVTEQESESYFKTRPRESQLSAWASEQSTVVTDRQYLEKRYDLYKNRFSNKPVERPPYWGGYRIIPDWFEFWQNGDFRLHDRLTYTKREDIWVIERLAP
jgi:pyridoxamine 5'-phosphate oxidase